MNSKLIGNVLRGVMLATTLALAATASPAQDSYPDKPIKLVVPFPPGSGPDVLARILAQALPEALSQPVVVENRVGGGGIPASDFVAKAAPNGYTILLGTLGTHTLNLVVYSKLPYDPVKDFAPITQVAQMPQVVVVGSSVPVKSMMEFVTYARARPTQLNYASAGVGSGMHMATELMKSTTSIAMVHVPYKGPSESINAVVSGDVALAIPVATAALPLVKAGRVRALAVTSSQRTPIFPDVPTMAEAGFPGFDFNSWYGLFAPAGTPAPVVQKLSQAVERVLKKPEVMKAMGDQGAMIIGNTPEQFASNIGADIVKWTKVVKDARLKFD